MNDNEEFNYAVSCLESLEVNMHSLMDMYKGRAANADVVIGSFVSERYLGMADAYEHIYNCVHKILYSIKGE